MRQVSLAALAAAVSTAGANAQGAASAQLEEVVVIAEKRAENLQEVPIVATAVSGDELAAKGAATTKDLQTIVPGLVFTQGLPAGNPYLRGVGQNSGAVGIESPVAFYVDGVYFAQSGASVLGLNNIEQITVLKGPQGTLFGRNASGGVIQVNTRAPSEDFTVDAKVGYANYHAFDGAVYVSGPLSSTVRASFSVFGSDQTEGFGRNLVLNKEIYKTRNYGGQARLQWRPTDTTTVDFNLLHTWTRTDTGIVRSVPKGYLAEDGRSVYVGEYNSVAAIDEPSQVKQTMAAVTATQDLFGARLQMIAAVHDYDEKYVFVQNGIPRRTATIASFDDPARTFTLEAQIQSPTDSALQWVVGGFYLDDEATSRFGVRLDAQPAFSQVATIRTESYAVFAQGTLPLSNATRMTAGLRYTKDRKELSGARYTGGGALIGTATTIARGGTATSAGFSPSTTWEDLGYRLSVDHDLRDDVMLYASYNRGFKSGLYNPLSFTNPPAAPETVDAFEVGVKTMFLDRRLRLNVGGFLYRYEDLQLRSVIPPSITPITFNAAESTIRGVDVDLAFKVTPSLTLTAAAEYLDATYDRFKTAQCTVRNPGGGNRAVPCDLSGTGMMRAPEWTGNIGATYVREMNGGATLKLDGTWSYNSGFGWEPGLRNRQEAYNSVSASARWVAPSERWDVMLWGTNLLDEDIRAQFAEGTSDVYSAGSPRRFGISFGYHY